MNKFCKHYKQNVIEKVSIERSAKLEEIVGKFQCKTCGYKYSRSSSNVYEAEIKVKRTLQWGEIWLEKLEEYAKENLYSISELSQIMGCDKQTIYTKLNDLKRTKRINIDIKVINEKKLEESKKIILEKFEQKQMGIKDIRMLGEFKYIDKYDPVWLLNKLHYERQEAKSTEYYLNLCKQQILEALQLNPNMTRQELYNKVRYDIVLKNDPIWLENNLPKPNVISEFIANTKNWEEQDKKLLELLKTKYEEFCNQDKVVKITKKKFKKEIGEISITNRSLEKMPLSSAYIDSVTDTPRSYRIKWYKKYINEKYCEDKEISVHNIPYFFHDFYKYKKDESVLKELEEYLVALKNKD